MSLLYQGTPPAGDLAEIHPASSSNIIFIVHGHDKIMKLEVARYIESFGIEAIILEEEAQGGRTIIEKFEASSGVGFVVVLFTGDDVGASREQRNDLKPRARQNVVFECGYFMGKISRRNVCCLVSEEVELPSDLSGLGYVKLDSGGGWKANLMKELVNAGYVINISKR